MRSCCVAWKTGDTNHRQISSEHQMASGNSTGSDRRARFGQHILDLLVHQKIIARGVYDAHQFRIGDVSPAVPAVLSPAAVKPAVGISTPFSLPLAGAYLIHLKSAGQKSGLGIEWMLQHFLEQLSRISQLPETLHSRLLPGVVSMADCWLAELALGVRPKGLVEAGILGTRMRVQLELDRPHGTGWLDHPDLGQLRLDPHEAVTLATRNLAELDCHFQPCGTDLLRADTVAGAAAAQLLLPGRFHGLDLNGDPVVLALHEDCLLVTGSRSMAGLKAMMEQALQEVGAPRPVLSPIPLIAQGSGWREWSVPLNWTAFADWQVLQQLFLQRVYREQDAVIKTCLADTPDEAADFHVAQYELVEVQSRGLRSQCELQQGTPGLIPKTDQVVLRRQGRREILQWEEMGTIGIFPQPWRDSKPLRFLA